MLTIVRKRLFLGLLLLAWIPFVIGAVSVYLSANFPQMTLLSMTAQRFRDFLAAQDFFVFVITVWVGAGLIANDKRANALQIYLSKPLGRVEYIAGKLAILAVFLLGVTLAPALLLLILQVLFTGSFSFLRQNFYLFPAVIVFSFLQVLLASFTMLALSSISKSSRYVAILYAGVIFFSDAVYGLVYLITGSSRMSWLSLPGNLRQIGDVVFRLEPRYATSPAISLFAILAVIGLAAWILERQVRGSRGGVVTEAAGVPPVVEAASLSKWYGQVIGLNDVTVTVPRGITGLLGPNGAGKSTFMKLMTGQLKPSKGSVRLLGQPTWGNPSVYFKVGFCPDQDAFYDRMTGLEWVTALVRLNGYDERQAAEAARRALATVDLLDAADRKIGSYSKGMRQRVKLAQAIVHDPDVLILDEPLSGMDPLGRRRTIRLIKEWARQGRSVIVSSHILHEIESMTSNILLINNGRILAEGNVHQIRDLIDTHPHTVYIRSADPRALARRFLAHDDVISLRFEEGAVVVQTASPDSFYSRLTELAASGEAEIGEVTSPDDNLQAVFQYLVK